MLNTDNVDVKIPVIGSILIFILNVTSNGPVSLKCSILLYEFYCFL